MYHQRIIDNEERRARLAFFVLELFPNIMQCSVSFYILKNGLSNKYCNNKRNPPVFTRTEMLLLKQLPNVQNFTVQLCYKLISFEELLPSPSCGWGIFPDSKAVKVEDDIERIRHVINDIIAINSDQCTEHYLGKFLYKLEHIIQRFQIALGNVTIFQTYQSLLIQNINTAVVLAELKNVGVIVSDVHHIKLQDRERYSKISAVITEFFPKILRNLIPLWITPSMVHTWCTMPSFKWDKSQQLQIQKLHLSLSYESLDASMLYQLFRRFSIVTPPTHGWGGEPANCDFEIADDIERIRLFRNKTAHRCDTCIDQTEFDNYFAQFRGITQRIAPEYEHELIAIADDSLDPTRQKQLIQALQELEDIKERFKKFPVRYYWGNDFDEKIKDIRQMVQSRKDIQGKETTIVEKLIIKIDLQDIIYAEKIEQILNELKTDINNGDFQIEFIGAVTGSLIIYAYTITKALTTDGNLQTELSSFMTRILYQGKFEIPPSQWIDAVIFPVADIKNITLTSSTTKSLSLQFSVNMDVFETDARFESEIGDCMQRTTKNLNGKGFTEDVIAIVDYMQSDDTEDRLDMETCQLVPVDKIESTVVLGSFDKDDTEDTLDMETCEHVPVDKLVEIDKESTVVSRSFDKDKTKETDYMKTSYLSPINKSVEIEEASTIFSDKTEKILHMETSQKRLIDKYVEMDNESPTVSGPPRDINKEKIRWLIVGICLNSIITPMLRKYVDPIIRNLYTSLVSTHSINTQGYHSYLQEYPPTNIDFLNYDLINNNRNVPKKKINNKWINSYQKYDYKVTSHVDLSKLFLQPNIAHYSAIDESCDSSALLSMIINISSFPQAVQTDADKIRTHIRSSWARCDFVEWTGQKYIDSFNLMGQLVTKLGLSNMEENWILGELNTWATNGQNYLSGKRLGFETEEEIRHQTQILKKYVHPLCTETQIQLDIAYKELLEKENDLQERFRSLESKTKEHEEQLRKISKQTEHRSLKRTKPPDLEREVKEMQTKIRRILDLPDDLDEKRKRWVIVGICFHAFISPVLRKYVVPVVTRLFFSLISLNKIHKQTYASHLKRYEPTNTTLNYETINNNKNKYGLSSARYDYRVKSAVDFSRLFLQTHMAHFTAFDDSCDLSALLEIIVSIDRFPPVVHNDARKIQSDMQKPWTNCEFEEWTAIEYKDAFMLMRHLISNVRLSNREENRIKEELHSWETNGRKFLSGERLDFEVVKEIGQQTHVLSEYVQTLCTGTDSRISQVQNELKDLENDLQKSITKEHGEELTQNELEVREWEQDQSTFVKTRATHHILESIPSHNCIVVTGSSGCGKSSNIHHAALHLRERFGYEIIPVLTGPIDIINYYNENKKQVFVVDDICGKETINKQTLQTWRDYSEKMEKIFESEEKSVKNKTNDNVSKVSSQILMVSSRLHIYKESQLRLFTLLSRKEFNLSSEEWGLSKEEKLRIANMYFSHDITDKMNVTQVIEEVDFFPLFCKCSQYKSTEEIIKPFTAPVDTITKNIYHIVHTHKEQFCALVLCILFEKGFDIHWLEANSVPREMKRKLEDVLEEFDIDFRKEMYRKSLKSGFLSLNCTYLKRRGSTYKMIHDKMYQLAAVICGQQLTECFIKYGSFTFIRDHYIFESISKGKVHDDLISLSDDKEEKYFERLLCDLKKRVLTSTFYNKQLKYQPFINKLIGFFGRNKEAIPFLRTLDEEGCKTKGNDCYETISTTPLIESSAGGYYDMVNFLIAIVKSNVKREDGRGRTSLYKASEGGKINVVKLLLENNADVLQFNYDKESPLYVACEEGHKTTVELLLQNHANVLQCDYEEKSPLYVASEGGHKDIVELLLNYKVDIFKCNNEERSPLFVACERGHTYIVELLLQNNADISKSDHEEKSPVYVACEGGHTDIVELLIKNNADILKCNYEEKSPVYVACERGHAYIVKLLHHNNADILKSDHDEKSPLYVACEGGHTDIVELLIQNNADISKCNNEEKSPLYVACEGGHTDIVELLIQNNADISQCNYEEKSPLYVACERGHTCIVILLHHNNADILKSDHDEKSPLYVACEGGHTDIVELLIQNNADISKCNNEVKSPLYVACERGHTCIVKLLIQNNADVSRCNYEEKSPLYIACEKGNADIVELLLQNIADVSACYYEKKSSMNVACERGHINIMKLLEEKGFDKHSKH